jgi:hypothetical protein
MQTIALHVSLEKQMLIPVLDEVAGLTGMVAETLDERRDRSHDGGRSGG